MKLCFISHIKYLSYEFSGQFFAEDTLNVISDRPRKSSNLLSLIGYKIKLSTDLSEIILIPFPICEYNALLLLQDSPGFDNILCTQVFIEI